MDIPTNIIQLNEIEQLYLYNLDQIKMNIINLIKEKQLDNTSYVITDDILKTRITSSEPYWHNYLMHGQYALSGDYPDEECEEHAISFGNTMMLKYCIDELSILSNVLKLFTAIVTADD